MGSTLLTLRTLLADQIDADTITAGSDPSKSLLNTYINNSIRKIARRDRPRELMQDTAISANITINTNKVTIPATMFVPDCVYYKDSGGNWTELRQKQLKDLIQISSPEFFFDPSRTGDPKYYVIRGTSIVFETCFSRTATSAINIFGVDPPSVLSADTDTTELPIDYDLLITYEAAILFAQRDDDEENINRWLGLARNERAELQLSLETNNSQQLEMDPFIFTGRTTNISNPSVQFRS